MDLTGRADYSCADLHASAGFAEHGGFWHACGAAFEAWIILQNTEAPYRPAQALMIHMMSENGLSGLLYSAVPKVYNEYRVVQIGVWGCNSWKVKAIT
ncbi:hypothetical protein C2I18_21670 [Paenibacillus sp. PK3_47]|nr:hypothetical protein C2I18_21670 [Paenibacillus sp. PK3_47]